MPPVNMYDVHGNSVVVQEQDVPGAIAQGLHLESPGEQASRVGAGVRQEQYGGPLGTAAAAGLGVARTVSFGLSDVLARAAGGEDTVRALQEVHPTVSTVAEIGGAFLPLGAGAIAGKIGAAIRGGEELGTLAKLGRSAVAGAAEGGLYGAGAGVSELALSDDPLTLEHAASVLSSNALYGAGTGSAIGLGGRAAELGLQRAKGALDDFVLARETAREVRNDPAALATADVTTLDRAGLRKAEAAEVERIETERMPARKQVLDDVVAYRDKMHDLDMLKVAHGVEDGEVREFGGSLKKSDRELRNALDKKIQLAEDPQRTLSILQQQEQAMANLEAWGREQMAGLTHADDQMRLMRQRIRNGEVEGYMPAHLTDRGIDFAAENELRKAGAALSSSFPEYQKLDKIVTKFPGAIDANRALQRRLTDLMAAPTSERLAAIADARDALGGPQQSAGSLMLHTMARFAGPIGAAVEHGTSALGALKKAAGATAERGAKVASSFLGAATKVAAEAPLATKVLAGLRFGEGKSDAAESGKLPDLFRARTDEVKAQVHIAADGSFQMRPAARQAMASRLGGLGAVDPVTADRLETAGARRITWLAAQIPRRPDVLGGAVGGPDRWHPSDMEMRSWARKAAALEDPHGVLERVVHGTVTPEDAMALRAVYPEIMDAFINEVSAKLPLLREALPYQKQLALSLFTGVPVDPALDPKILSVLQGHFTDEVGTAGGTQAPMARPAFGSLKKSPDAPTPAQTRSQGVHL